MALIITRPPVPSAPVRKAPVTCQICGWACDDYKWPRKALDFGGGKGICETCLDDDRGESK